MGAPARERVDLRYFFGLRRYEPGHRSARHATIDDIVRIPPPNRPQLTSADSLHRAVLYHESGLGRRGGDVRTDGREHHGVHATVICGRLPGGIGRDLFGLRRVDLSRDAVGHLHAFD